MALFQHGTERACALAFLTEFADGNIHAAASSAISAPRAGALEASAKILPASPAVFRAPEPHLFKAFASRI